MNPTNVYCVCSACLWDTKTSVYTRLVELVQFIFIYVYCMLQLFIKLT
jgi:hypothetical protein